MRKYYTGVGSRSTPPDILELMSKIAKDMQMLGYVLRSGGAGGADEAFEKGADEMHREIYLPWQGFNGNGSKLAGVCNGAIQRASEIHPAWARCSVGVKKLHARNVYQVLGKDLKTPSEILICWTRNAEVKGGTATAIRLAKEVGAKVYNLCDENRKNDLLKWIKEEKEMR